MDSNSRQIEEDEDHNNNLNRNSHYSALICPVTRTNFSGIIMNYINELQNESTDIKNYFEGWICYSLFQRNIEKNQLSISNSKNYLYEILKII